MLKRFIKEGVMERILVAMDPVRNHFFAGIHALNLAKRIQAKVLFLLVFSPRTRKAPTWSEKSKEMMVKKRVEALIEKARSEGIAIDYYLIRGDYESELVSFVQENNITLLVMECPPGHKDAAEGCRDFLDNLRHRINCRIEIVNEKPDPPERKE